MMVSLEWLVFKFSLLTHHSLFNSCKSSTNMYLRPRWILFYPVWICSWVGKAAMKQMQERNFMSVVPEHKPSHWSTGRARLECSAIRWWFSLMLVVRVSRAVGSCCVLSVVCMSCSNHPGWNLQGWELKTAILWAGMMEKGQRRSLLCRRVLCQCSGQSQEPCVPGTLVWLGLGGFIIVTYATALGRRDCFILLCVDYEL